MASNTDRLNRSTRHLEEGLRVGVEAQEVAKGILTDLDDQRKTIVRARNRLGETDGTLAKSQRVLGRIYERCAPVSSSFFFLFFLLLGTHRPSLASARSFCSGMKHKLVMALIIIVAIVIIALIIYLIARK